MNQLARTLMERAQVVKGQLSELKAKNILFRSQLAANPEIDHEDLYKKLDQMRNDLDTYVKDIKSIVAELREHGVHLD
jgi:hypothetical protein